MALAPLATIADMEALGVTVEASEEPIVEQYLKVASASVRDAAGCPISQGTSTVALEGVAGRRLPLPGPPVTAVDTVLVDGTEVTDYRLVSGALWRRAGWQAWGGEPVEVEATYTHGLPEVPDDIIDLVCRIAATTLVLLRSAEGGEGLAPQRLTQERIGDYSASFSDDGTLTEVELPETTRNRLRARFGGGAAVLRVVS